MPANNPGRFNRLVKFRKRSDAEYSALGGMTVPDTFSVELNVWCHVYVKSGKQFNMSDQDRFEITTVFECWYRPEITQAFEILHKGVIYDIDHVEEVGLNEYLRIRGRARVE